jgi:hypothetical protein
MSNAATCPDHNTTENIIIRMTHAQYVETTQPGARPLSTMLALIRSAHALSLDAKFLIAIFGVLILWAISVLAIGVPALVWPMKVVVPAMFLCLVCLTWGM